MSFDTITRSPLFFTDEHRELRRQLRRFVEDEIKPHAAQWEADGMVPRAALRRMGEMGRSTFAGVAITALVHTDMASVHIFNAGSAEQKARWLPKVISGAAIAAVAVTEPGAGSDVKAMLEEVAKRL